MSNFLSIKFLDFVLGMLIGFLIFNTIYYFVLKYIIKSKYIKDIKFDFKGNWIDKYLKNKFSKG